VWCRGRDWGSNIRCSSVLTIILLSTESCLHSAGVLLGATGGIESAGCLSHYLEAIRSTTKQCHVARIHWVIELLSNLQECLSALCPPISQAWLLCLYSNRGRRWVSLRCPGHRVIIGLNLALLASGRSIRRGWGSILG
jgi:hypothetical protein